MKILRKRHLVRKKLWWEASRKEETKKKVEKYREKDIRRERERERERASLSNDIQSTVCFARFMLL